MTQEVPVPLSGTSRAEQAYACIEEMIVTLRLAPGEHLTEQALCTLLNMGRTPVREAVLMLKQDHLLRVLPRQGIVITPIDTQTALEALEVRYRIEGLLIERATRLADEGQRYRFAHLAGQAEATIREGDNVRFARIDGLFNALVCDAARQPVATRSIQPLHAVSRRIGFFLSSLDHLQLENTGLPHVAIMQAIGQGDEQGALAALGELHQRTREQTLTIEREGLLYRTTLSSRNSSD